MSLLERYERQAVLLNQPRELPLSVRENLAHAGLLRFLGLPQPEMFDAHANFAYSTVATAPSPASSGTSLVVHAGDGAKFPAVPFNATVWPANAQPLTTNAEIVRVTAVSTDTFTITRAQESTSARAIVAGDQIALTITKKIVTDIETATLDQFGAPASDLSLGGHQATNAQDPTTPQALATKNYVDAVALGLTFKQPAALGTIAALPANVYANGALGVGATLIATGFGALSVDGTAVTVGQRILVKNEAAPANNGIYTVTATGGAAAFYTLTRATDFNQSSEIQNGDAVIVQGGTLTDTLWVQTTAGAITVGTTAIAFSQLGNAPVTSVFGRTGTVVAANADYMGVVASALTGATAATRYVGGTTFGPPTSGTFAVGDFVIDQTGNVWVCTVAGTPGTWLLAPGGWSNYVDINTTNAFTNIISQSIPGGTLGTSRALRVTVAGYYLNNTGAARGLALKILYGATTLWGDTSLATFFPTSASTYPFFMTFLLYAKNSTSTQILSGRVGMGLTTAGSIAGTGAFSDAEIVKMGFDGSASEDSTAAKTLAVQAQLSASSANLVLNVRSRVEILS